ncbi:MAG: CPBP family intramembrane metalloprotease [Verrucomicrobia bacterium]|nr:CPBP family intramembrane metalloprotease [Verrucomicrobiota bacterium]
MLAEKPWKPDAVLRYLLALFTSIFSGVLLVGWLNSPSSPFAFDPRFVTVVVGALTFHGMALALTHFFLREHDVNWSAGFGFRSPRVGRSLLLAGIVGVAVLPMAWSLARVSAKIMAKFHFDPIVQDTVQTLQAAESTELKILLGLLAVFVAPVAEELVFRGILYPAIKQRGFPRLALWGTSLLFAAIHNNAMIFLSLTLLAVLLTLLYETTDNLLAPILTHSLFNLANFFWLIFQPGVRPL